jgi:hypothetical protein
MAVKFYAVDAHQAGSHLMKTRNNEISAFFDAPRVDFG